MKSSENEIDASKVLQRFQNEVILVEETFGLWRALNLLRSPSAKILYSHIPEFADNARSMAADQIIIIIARLLDGRRDVFSLNYVLKICTCSSSEIQAKVDEAVERFKKFAKNVAKHRHNRVAHLNRKLYLQDDGWTELPTGPAEDLDNAVNALTEIHCLLVEDMDGATSYNWRQEDESGRQISTLDGGVGVLVSLIARFNEFTELSFQGDKLTDEQIGQAIRTGNIQQVLDSIETDQNQVDI